MNIDFNNFFSKAKEPDENGCMLWKLSLDSNGYGSFYLPRSVGKRRRLNSHRVSFYLHNNRWPKENHYIIHTCENRHCINIKHLEEVTKNYKYKELLKRGEKECSGCNIIKPLDDFGRKDKNKFNHNCKVCVRAYDKIWYQNNKEKHKAHQSKYKKNNFFKQYGLIKKEYEELVNTHKRLCAICGDDKPLVIDHCHLCGFGKKEAVRGLLCRDCNTHSNFSLEKPEVLTKALEYAIIHIDKYHVPPSFNG